MNIKTVAVIGAGVMGRGLALDLAAHGFEVIVKDIAAGALEELRHGLRSELRLTAMTRPTFPSVTLEEVESRLELTLEYDRVQSVDFVIENVTEDYDTKRTVYLELEETCRPEVVFAANTSCISITKLASLVRGPERVIGMHLMNPVPMKTMVEVVRGYHTSHTTITATTDLLERLQKVAVIVNDYPGFVTNRVLMLTINECVFVVQDGVAAPADIDKLFRLGFAHQMGPLATADLIGLDTILNSLHVLYESYKDSKYRPCPLLVKMVDAGLLGRKTGKGFFEYDNA